jgi:hypothetical protein
MANVYITCVFGERIEYAYSMHNDTRLIKGSVSVCKMNESTE